MLLLENAVSPLASSTDLTATKRWINKLKSIEKELSEMDPVDNSNSTDLVFDGYAFTNSKL